MKYLNQKCYFDFSFHPGTYFIFGKETKGLPEKIIKENWEYCYRIPILNNKVRSLNLANAVGIVLYEAIRQLDIEINNNL